MYLCVEVYNTGTYGRTFVNIGFRFTGLNAKYIVSYFFHTHFSCDYAISPTLCYLKWSQMWCFISVHRFII